MTYDSQQRRFGRRGVVALLIALLVGASLLIDPASRSIAAQSDSPAAKLAALKMKFDGARSCGGKNCHDKAGADVPPAEPGHESTIWNDADRHRKSFETLGEKASTDIGAKLKIADVKTSDRCLNCHSLHVPADLQGQKFNAKEGNSCTQCHGPSQKWLEPHAEKGWTEKQRAATKTHDALLAQWGLYDTKPLVKRAEICVSCHLEIEADLVAAGHPQPEFDLDYFTLSQPKHWKDPDGYFEAKIWLAGQSAAVEASKKQLATRTDPAAQQQAKAHQAVVEAAAKAMGITVAAVESATPDKKGTLAALNAIAAMDLIKDAGKFGMNQQAYAITALYNAYASAEKVPDAQRDEMNKLIESKLFPPEKGELTPEQFARNLPEVKAKLPAP